MSKAMDLAFRDALDRWTFGVPPLSALSMFVSFVGRGAGPTPIRKPLGVNTTRGKGYANIRNQTSAGESLLSLISARPNEARRGPSSNEGASWREATEGPHSPFTHLWYQLPTYSWTYHAFLDLYT